MDRLDVGFPSGGVECAAWLYLADSDRPGPVIVMAHGLGGVRELRLDAYAERFRAEGYACLVFDYRHFGASGGEPRQVVSVRRQIEDWRAAIAYARSRPDVDADRVILWGTSFSGGHVLELAARDHGVVAVVSQCPFTDGAASMRAADLRSAAKVGTRVLRDLVAARMGWAPVAVAIVGVPGSAALMSAPDVEPGYLALVPEGASFPNEVAARSAVEIMGYSPGRHTAAVRCPVLFCVCEADSVAPAQATLRHCAEAPRGEVRLYDRGHFDIYVGAGFEEAVADQIDFLGRHVPCDSESSRG